MIGKLLATTAFATLLATGALAQENTAPATEENNAAAPAAPANSEQMQPDSAMMNGYLASNLIGENVYNGVIQAGGAMQNGQAANGQAAQNVDPAAQNQAAQNGDQAAQGQDAQTAQNGDAAGGAVNEDGQNVQISQDGESIQTAETIGDVNDVVIGQNGQVEALVVGVGGFLGIGEKDVALPFDQIQWARGQDGDPYIVVSATRESLEALPEFDRSSYGQPSDDATAMNTGAETGTTNGGMAPAADATGTAAATGAAVNSAANGAENAADATANTAQNAADAATGNNGAATDTTQTGAIDRSQLQQIAPDQMTAETLVGTTVYGANDENIGEIGDIVLTQDGKVDAVLVDVGGFLGIGEKRVAVGMDKLQFLQDGNGNRYLYTNFTQEQLNAQAAYDEGSYSQNRDQQRLIVQ